MNQELLQRIEVKNDVLAGKPIIKNTRIAVEHILKALVQGMSREDICKGYGIENEDITAVLYYAEKVIEQEKIVV